MIALPPRATPQLRCCSASGCRSAGGEALLQGLQAAARAAAGLEAAASAQAASGAAAQASSGPRSAAAAEPKAEPDAAAEVIAVKAVGCLRLCGRGPLVACDGPGGTALFGDLRPEQAPALVALALGRSSEAGPLPAAQASEHQAEGAEPARPAPSCADPQAGTWSSPTGSAAAAVHRSGDGDPSRGLVACRIDLQLPFFALQRSLVLERCGLIDPDSLEEALAHGAYRQLQRCRRELSPEQVRAEVRRSGLRGRGGAGYPTGLKWDTVALQPAGPRYVVCNADEGDPGAFMNRSVLEGDPHRLLEGLAIAAHAVGAAHGFLYVRAEYPLAISRLRRALAQARERGLFGGGAGRLELEVRVGAGAYVCGEETALLASIQGRRGTPRPRPPFPAQAGLWGAPTLINNVETLATIPLILREGGAWYAAIGSPTSPGTKVFALSGAVRHTGLVEVPLGTSLRTIVSTIGAGALDQPDLPGGGALKAVQTGGPSGGCIPADRLDTPVDYESLQALGASMGSGGLVVIDQGTAMPELARHFMAFSVSESCGKCVPCRAGTVQLALLLDRLLERRAAPADLERLEELCAMVRDTSLCGLGQTAPNPVLSSLRWFRQEYLELCRPWP